MSTARQQTLVRWVALLKATVTRKGGREVASDSMLGAAIKK
jgi:hypothetical protein